ncbi:MAG: hypothetical protein JO297_02055 [Nitrososphaeraceae archaeon]|nr:hypothetical protein [Nitrososphaeraceae archaeon]
MSKNKAWIRVTKPGAGRPRKSDKFVINLSLAEPLTKQEQETVKTHNTVESLGGKGVLIIIDMLYRYCLPA